MIKKHAFAVLFTAFSISQLQAQSDTVGSGIQVKYWGNKLFMAGDSFWEPKMKPLDAQLGVGGYEKVRKYSDYHNLPAEMQLFDGKRKLPLKEYHAKLSQLKGLRKVASFQHISTDGKDHGEYVVVQVPYEQNENWQPGVKWDTVFFILPAADTEQR